MKCAIIVLVLVKLLAWPTTAIAEATDMSKATGNDMLELCEINRSVCIWYAMGWDHGHDVSVTVAGWQRGRKDIKAILRLAPTGICAPPQATNHQLGDVLIKYLQDHPKKQHEPIRDLTALAFREAFPCQ